MKLRQFVLGGLLCTSLSTATATTSQDVNNTPNEEPTQVFFGDTHLHTNYSFDAYLNQNQTADPDTAFRFAKGQAVIHPRHRARVQLGTPLDFLVIADHAEMLGLMRGLHTETAELEELGFVASIKRAIAIFFMNRAIDKNLGLEFFGRFLPVKAENPGADPVADAANNIDDVSPFGDTSKIAKTAWEDIVDTADRHNEPGNFTALIGWEWSSIPTGANLHRVVFTPDGGEMVKSFLPYDSGQSQYPEDLWKWLEETQNGTGTRFVAIPHNSNISKGYMFAETTLKGKPITSEYARTRMQWEPVAEATQIKGDSETHSKFSPEDEFADFENFDGYIQLSKEKYTVSKGDFIRPALKTGLAIEKEVGVNPYKFGLIGSTDSHTGLASYEENNFMGKTGADSIPESKHDDTRERVVDFDGWSMSASGLAAVWAKENTREEIFNAFQRKEVYATTGPRIKLRMFGGWEFEQGTEQAKDFAEIGYTKGVPMGGDLTKTSTTDSAPQFIIQAVKDPKEANLDRVQIIKGWVDAEGVQHEKVYNVAWSGDRSLDANGKLPPVGNTVDVTKPSYTNTIGSTELTSHWQDPEFNPAEHAFYYVRVLQIPTPRHLQFDAAALGMDKPRKGPQTLQERAYSSPIWYTP